MLDDARDPREVVRQLCVERGQDFASLSRLVGRNSAYIQQYVKRGTPRRLPEQERRIIARHFNIPEAMLGGPIPDKPEMTGLVPVGLLDVRASAGPGAFPEDEQPKAYFAFDEGWLKRVTSASAEQLSLIKVEGDSMAPTLVHGDDILVDRSDAGSRIRDGIYVLRIEDVLMVKRLTLHPISRRVTVQSDNPAYADWPDIALSDIDCIGRVVWSGRRVD